MGTADLVNHAPWADATGGGNADRDAELVAASRRGDRAAFTELVERHRHIVHSLAYALTGNLTETEEVVQEAFITAWKQLSDMQYPERFRGWICGIARLASLGVRREERRRFLRLVALPSAPEAEIPSIEPSPLDHAISREEERFIWKCLAALPETYRVPLVLFYMEQQSIASVAEALGVSEGVVGSRLWRGRRMLHKQVVAVVESTLARMKARKEITASILAAFALTDPKPTNAATAGFGRTATLLYSAAVTILLATGGMTYRRGDPASLPAEGSIAQATRLPTPLAWTATGFRADGPFAGEIGTKPHVASGVTIMRFDFEDGLLPAAFTEGLVVTGAPRAGNRSCVQAVLIPDFGHFGQVVLGLIWDATPVATYSPTTRVSFDYWVGRDWDGLSVQVWNNARGCNYGVGVTATVPERWEHAEVRLADLRPYQDDAPAMEEGDQLRNLVFSGGWVGGKPFYVDNIRILDSASREPQ